MRSCGYGSSEDDASIRLRLCHAILHRHPVRKLVEDFRKLSPAIINEPHGDNPSPIQLAVKKRGGYEVVKYLLSKGGCINPDKIGVGMFHSAAYSGWKTEQLLDVFGSREFLKKIHEFYPRWPYETDKDAVQAIRRRLNTAINNGDSIDAIGNYVALLRPEHIYDDIVGFLLDVGLDEKGQPYYRIPGPLVKSPIQRAAMLGRHDVVKLSLKTGGVPASHATKVVTLFFYAVFSPHWNVAQLLDVFGSINFLTALQDQFHKQPPSFQLAAFYYLVEAMMINSPLCLQQLFEKSYEHDHELRCFDALLKSTHEDDPERKKMDYVVNIFADATLARHGPVGVILTDRVVNSFLHASVPTDAKVAFVSRNKNRFYRYVIEHRKEQPLSALAVLGYLTEVPIQPRMCLPLLCSSAAKQRRQVEALRRSIHARFRPGDHIHKYMQSIVNIAPKTRLSKEIAKFLRCWPAPSAPGVGASTSCTS